MNFTVRPIEMDDQEVSYEERIDFARSVRAFGVAIAAVIASDLFID